MAEESLQVRNERALNATSTDELEELAEDEDEDVRLRVARNANTPASVLEQLAADENWQVRFNVAENMNTPLSVLEKLAEDDERDIRNYVAKNENTSVSILEKLADDKDDYLRINVAEHKNTSVLVLEKLAEDENEYVREAVATNADTPASVLEKLGMSEDSTSDEQDVGKKKYEVTLNGIGGEVVVGSITKEQYDYWVDKDDDEIYQHFLEDDIEDSEVPSEAWIGNRWFEMDNIEHLNGCELSNVNNIDVLIDGNERSLVFECNLGKESIKGKGIKIELNKVDWKGLEKGYYFLYQPLEKGGLTIQIETENEFDPKMLTLICTEFVMPNKKGCFISSSVLSIFNLFFTLSISCLRRSSLM